MSQFGRSFLFAVSAACGLGISLPAYAAAIQFYDTNGGIHSVESTAATGGALPVSCPDGTDNCFGGGGGGDATAANQTTQITQETATATGVGAPADSAWVSGSGSIIAVLKGIFGKLSAALAVSQSGTWTGQPIAGTANGCAPYHLAGGTGASTNANSIKGSAGNLCDLTLVNTTTTIYFFKIYDTSSGTPTCSSATGIKHVIPIPPAAAAGGAGGLVRSLALGESYASGIGYCVTGGGSDTDATNAATGVYIEASYK